MRGAVVVCIGFALALAAGSSALQPGPSQIQIIDRVVSEETSFDQRVIKTLLINRGSGAIGNSVLICNAIGSARGPVPPGAQYCSGVYRFAHGNIVVTGYMGRRGLYTLAVTGGTGLYSNTGAGQMAAVTINLEPREQALSFSLYSS